jgi:hypothetical protein
MVMVRHIRVFVGVLLLCIFGLSGASVLYGYDNEGPHRAINRYAVEIFLGAVQGSALFARYDFRDGKPLLGKAVTESGTWKIQEDFKSRKWDEWIVEGGYSADEPELYMSLRYFYDPLGLDGGATYLTDLPALYRTWNPRMDARRWAVYESPYSLQAGKIAMIHAFGSRDPILKEKHFARAWRSLGEAMHLLADMTVPAHVRNDAHPVEEPYEEMVTEQMVAEYARGVIEPGIFQAIKALEKEETNGLSRAEKLFDLVARYTNQNYFSADTIAGQEFLTKKRLQNNNKRPPYPSPLLSQCATEEGVEGALRHCYYYQEDHLGKRYLAKAELQGKRLRVIIDERCVRSQAERLIPVAVWGGAVLLDWFMPRLQIVLDLVYQSGLSGTLRLHGRVIHLPWGIQDRPLLYTHPTRTPIGIFADGNIWTVSDGSIRIEEGTIDGTIALKTKAPLRQFGLSLDIGGIIVTSPIYLLPALTVTPEAQDGRVGEEIRFRIDPENAPSVVSYRIEFGDGRESETSDTAFSHVFQDAGTFTVVVSMRDGNGQVLTEAYTRVKIVFPEVPEIISTEAPPSPQVEKGAEEKQDQILAEYRALYPVYLKWYYRDTRSPFRIELLANAEEVAENTYRVAYRLWQVIDSGPRQGEEYVATLLDRLFTLQELEADLTGMKKSLGQED